MRMMTRKTEAMYRYMHFVYFTTDNEEEEGDHTMSIRRI